LDCSPVAARILLQPPAAQNNPPAISKFFEYPESQVPESQKGAPIPKGGGGLQGIRDVRSPERLSDRSDNSFSASRTDHRYLFHPYPSIREGCTGVSGLNRFLSSRVSEQGMVKGSPHTPPCSDGYPPGQAGNNGFLSRVARSGMGPPKQCARVALSRRFRPSLATQL
jgi:hypothetical protein